MNRADKFLFDGERPVLTQCAYCKHRSESADFPVCPAFPGWIPGDILTNRFDHRTPHPDEMAPVRFTPRDDVPPDTLDRLYAKLDTIP